MIHIITVVDQNSYLIGRFNSLIVPRVNEILEASNGDWLITKVEYRLSGPLLEDYELPTINSIIIYAVPL